MHLRWSLCALLCFAIPCIGADSSRAAAFGLHCFPPDDRASQTQAQLVGHIETAARTLDWTATCADGPSTSPVPVLLASDGPVLRIDLAVTVTLATNRRRGRRLNVCTGTSANGFLLVQCEAAEGRGGLVSALVSIAPIP